MLQVMFPEDLSRRRYGVATQEMAAVCHLPICGKVTGGFQSDWRRDQVAAFHSVVGIEALCDIGAY